MPCRKRAQRDHTLLRSGTTAVEAALVLPVFITFIIGIIEYGHAQMVANMMKSACRMAARYGSTEGATTSEAISRVNQMLSSAAPSSAFTVVVKNAAIYDQAGATLPATSADFAAMPNIELSTSGSKQLFLVRASVPYNSIAIMPLKFMSNVTLTGQAFMRHE
jgi:Flp pilus assembly protein TadG